MEKINETLKNIGEAIDKIKNKECKIVFLSPDTKGTARASVAYIYRQAMTLKNNGYNVSILHEKNDYKLIGDENGNGVGDWLGEEYAKLPHASIESQNLNISPADFIIIPEIFANIMDQVKGFPCKKVVFSQSYDYLLELLQIGKRWNVDYGFNDVITTSEKHSEFVLDQHRNLKSRSEAIDTVKWN